MVICLERAISWQERLHAAAADCWRICRQHLLQMAVKQEKQDERAAVNQKAEKLLKDYGNSILRMAYAYLHNMSDAEDILQETLIQYLQTAPVLENPVHEKAWLLKVAANLSKNRIDYNRIRQTDELEETLVAEKREDLRFVWEAVRALPKNNIVPMRLARRILPFAACVVIVVAGLAVPQIRQKILQNPQKPGEEKPAVEGVYAPQEVASAEKLTDAVGFPVRDIASLKEKATDRSYVTYGDGLAEITYRWDSQSICFRQSQGQEDNSGDYTHYAEEKLIVVGKYSVTFKGQEKGSYMIATWSDGTYSFSVSATQALKKAEFLGLIEEIEKNI